MTQSASVTGHLDIAPAETLSPPRVPSAAIHYGVAALTVALVAAPIVPIVYQAFVDRALHDVGQQFTMGNFARLAAVPEFWRMAGDTLLFGVITTVVAQLIGTSAAILVGRTDMPGRRLIGEVFIWPLYVSSLILSFAWVTVYGPSGYVTQWLEAVLGAVPWDLYTRLGMGLVAGVSLAPVSFIYLQASASVTDASFEEAARIAGAGRFRTLTRITLPLMRPSLFFSTILIFTSAVEILSIPLVFGSPANVQVFSTFLYLRISNAAVPDYAMAAAASLILIGLIWCLIALQSWALGATRRFETVGGKATRPRPFNLGMLRWPCFVLMLAYVAFAILLPLALLLLRSFVSFLHPLAPLSDVATLANYAALWEFPSYTRSIVNSLIIATFGGMIATSFIVLLAIVVQRSEFVFRKPLLYVALAPRAIPGLIAGIGFFYAVALIPGFGWLRSTVVILMIAFTVSAIPAGYGAVAPFLMKISPELDRAARVQGASWWTASTKVLVPLLRPAYIACFAILFISFFKEYSTAVFLYAPGSEVIGTTLLQFWTQGNVGHVAALSAVQVVIIGICVFATRSLLKVNLHG